MITRSELAGQIGTEINKTVMAAKNHTGNWDENHISRNICGALGKRLDSFEENGRKFQIGWSGHKLKANKKGEQKFGDIGIYISIAYQDGFSLEGAAFFEAKVRYPDTGRFEATDCNQFRRILRSAPGARVLYYDYEDAKETSAAHGFIKHGGAWVPDLNPVHALSAPMNTVLKSAITNASIYRFCHPLSYQMAYRCFRGLDLEFSDEAIKIVKGYYSFIGLPANVLKVSIQEGLEPNPDQKTSQVNSEFYDEI